MKTIELTQGYVTMVDDADFEWLNQWKWQACPRTNTIYAGRGNGSRDEGFIRMHRLIMNAPTGITVDHKNLNGLDNQRHNLRLATHSQQMMNRPQHRSLKDSKYKGVRRYGKTGRWTAKIGSNGKAHNLGVFETEEDAARAYNIAATRLHGEFARLNVIPTKPTPTA